MPSFTAVFSLLFIIAPFASAAPSPPQLEERHAHDHEHTRRSILPTNWYHKRDHPVRNLLKRQDEDLPEVGSAEWRAAYPTGPPEANMPQLWLDALREAVAANLIPNVPVAGAGSTYPGGNAAGPEICSSTFQCRHPEDIWDAPDNMIGLSVDDGPVSIPDASPRLYDFLRENNQKVTHFMIGQNILFNPEMFLRVHEELENDIAVHTWSHRRMSTLTNEQILAELGWTLQIIHDSTEGRIPRYWRPPYGDADNRVRAIAREVFGLTTVIWNRDTSDWNLNTGATTLDRIQTDFRTWLTGPRSPGLIILEHEISAGNVQAFINALPLIRSFPEWTAVSVSQLFEDDPDGFGSWYLNAQNNTSPVSDMDVGGPEPDTIDRGAPNNNPSGVSGSSTSSATATTTREADSSSSGSGAMPSLQAIPLLSLTLSFVLGACLAL